ncbi:MAG: glycerol-3-phosphate 1-O-acyltransferase PlsY [Alphaproteobacteria bacterium]|jgi:glycerol-3-phosphate acyltransferase PlsY|nr:glycerol-3-phosphate 1-O-acyltransferase PlsY [Alphaproteobacteria bacterium]
MQYGLILVAYLSGSVPYGLIFTKIFGGVDVRKIGSGNIGTTNVLRTGQKGLAATTLFFDFFKGFLPVWGASYLGIEGILLLSIAFAAVIGHVFPIWLKYQGGKGVATALGVFWALSLPLGVFSTFMWIVITRFVKISSLSSLCMFALAPLFAALVVSPPMAVFCLAIALLIFWTHRSNIERLINGKEKGIGEN